MKDLVSLQFGHSVKELGHNDLKEKHTNKHRLILISVIQLLTPTPVSTLVTVNYEELLTLASSSGTGPSFFAMYANRSSQGSGLSMTSMSSRPRSYQSRRDTDTDGPTAFSASFNMTATSTESLLPSLP